MHDTPRPTRRTAAALLLLAGCLVVLGAVRPVTAQDTSVSQLRLELQNLAYRLDLENRQLRTDVDRLERRLREVEDARFRDSIQPSPAGPPVAAPLPMRSFGEEIVARRFVVEDAEGRIRAVLAVSEIHGPMLALLDENGEIGALTRIEAETPR